MWHDGKMVKSRHIGQIALMTNYPLRIGAREEDDRYFKGKISCIQIYNKALLESQIGDLRHCPKKGSFLHLAIFNDTNLPSNLLVVYSVAHFDLYMNIYNLRLFKDAHIF